MNMCFWSSSFLALLGAGQGVFAEKPSSFLRKFNNGDKTRFDKLANLYKGVLGLGDDADHGSFERIIGGKIAPAWMFRYAVYLQGEKACTGSLIAQDVVLSAAHCQGMAIAAIGFHHLTIDEGEVIDVASEVIHPNYNGTTLENDVMLVFLAEPANETMDLVKLNSDISFPASGVPLQAAGWGRTDPHDENSASLELKYLDMTAITNEECENIEGCIEVPDEVCEKVEKCVDGILCINMPEIFPLGEAKMCAEDKEEGVCNGDSGGPLIVEGSDGSGDVQVGVNSYVNGGQECVHEDFTAVYARVSTFYGWIRDLVCDGSNFPPSYFECPSNIESLY